MTACNCRISNKAGTEHGAARAAKNTAQSGPTRKPTPLSGLASATHRVSKLKTSSCEEGHTVYTSIAACNNWFYTAKGVHDEEIVFAVAAWALTDSGEIIGLIGQTGAVTKEHVARLTSPPPIKGSYLTGELLTASQRLALEKG